MINLNRFAQTQQVIAPIVDGWGQVNGRKLYLSVPDGWYRIQLDTKALILGSATPLEIDKVLRQQLYLRVYAYGSEGVPLNFDNFARRGFAETVKVNFLNLQPFQLAKIVLWEDDRFYFWEADARTERETVRRVREAFNADQSIMGMKYISPELRYYFLLLNFQKQSFRQLEELEKLKLSMEEKKKRMEEFRNTFAGRLEAVITKAGGTLVKFIKSRGNSYMVHWRVNGQLVKSQIDDELRIISAGFCLSGEDTKHTMGSIVNLAKLFQQDAPLYIFRE
jgi:hypothetical protein